MSFVCVFGVAGCGKSTVARQLQEKLGDENAAYLDADQFHSEANKQKMKNGIPLTDEDRADWLLAMQRAVNDIDVEQKKVVILACSALKKKYRDVLRNVNRKQRVFVHLSGSRDAITQRVTERKDHYMPASLVQSQFETLELPNETDEPDCFTVSIDCDKSRDEILNEAIQKIQ